MSLGKEELRVDITGNSSGLNRAVAQAEGSLRRFSGEQMASLGNKLKGAFGITAIAMGTAMLLENADAIDEVSKALGISAGNYQTLNEIIKTTGGSTQALTGVLNKLRDAADTALSEGGPSADAFETLGIHVKELRSLAPDEILQRIAAAMREHAGAAGTYSAAAALLGKRTMPQISGLMDELGKTDLSALREEMTLTGRVMNDEMVARLGLMKDQLDGWKTSVGVGLSYVVDGISTGWSKAKIALQAMGGWVLGKGGSPADLIRSSLADPNLRGETIDTLRTEMDRLAGDSDGLERFANGLKDVGLSLDDLREKAKPEIDVMGMDAAADASFQKWQKLVEQREQDSETRQQRFARLIQEIATLSAAASDSEREHWDLAAKSEERKIELGRMRKQDEAERKKEDAASTRDLFTRAFELRDLMEGAGVGSKLKVDSMTAVGGYIGRQIGPGYDVARQQLEVLRKIQEWVRKTAEKDAISRVVPE